MFGGRERGEAGHIKFYPQQHLEHKRMLATSFRGCRYRPNPAEKIMCVVFIPYCPSHRQKIKLFGIAWRSPRGHLEMFCWIMPSPAVEQNIFLRGNEMLS